jgi:hypothetical protein
MSVPDEPAVRTRSKSAPIQPIPPYVPSPGQQDTKIQTPTIVPHSDPLVELSAIYPDNTHNTPPCPHMLHGYYDNNRINHCQPGRQDQSFQNPLDRGYDYRNPGVYQYPTQYTQPMYSAKNWQDYMCPNIPVDQGFLSNPGLQPILLPEVFRINTHYLWAVKEYSTSKVSNTLLAAIAKSDLRQ